MNSFFFQNTRKSILFFLLLIILFSFSIKKNVLALEMMKNNEQIIGHFIKINSNSRTAVFAVSNEEEFQVLFLDEKLILEEIPLQKKVMVSLNKNERGKVIKDISIMFIDMDIQNIIALMIIGLIGGLLSGFIGTGGAFVLTPAMMSLGVPGAIAVASNMCHKFPKAMVGAYKRYKYGQVDLKLAFVMAASSLIGVQIGIQIQKNILNTLGNNGSNLYVSVVFFVVLIIVGCFVTYDAFKLSKKVDLKKGYKVPKLAKSLMKLEIPPMLEFKVAKVRISAWITIPIGVATGMLAATIAVGGFIGVPGMIYVIGASAVVASATELVIAFFMGAWGSVQWGLSGMIDIRLTLLILSTSLIGVQLGALGTTYVKDYMIKVVMAVTMIIVAISRGVKIPGYLSEIGWLDPLDVEVSILLNAISFWTLVAALVAAASIISVVMIKGIASHSYRKELPKTNIAE